MGVCKKCRRKTELFCWHCTKHVCFDCVIEEEHKLAYIGNYEEWLNFPKRPEPSCPLSNRVLTASDEVIRFMNMQLFLLSAIDDYGKSKPPNTALAGFTIPGTNDPMVPPPEEKSKLAQQIRQLLSRFAWISNLIALQAEIAPETQGLQPQIKTQPQPTASFADPLAKPEGYAFDANTTDKSVTNEIESNYTSDPLSAITQTSLATRKGVSNVPSSKKIARQGSLELPADLHVDPQAPKVVPYSPTRFREEDADVDKYKRRPVEMEALGFGSSSSSRTGARANRYQITGKRLLLTLALIITLLVVFFLSMGIDEDTTMPLYEGLEENIVETAKNITQTVQET